MYALLQKIINVIDQYNEGLIDADEAIKKIIYDVSEYVNGIDPPCYD